MPTLKLEKASFLNPEPPLEADLGFGLVSKLGLNQPDLHRNPLFWVRFLVDGPALLRRTVALADEADDIADLGAGSAWLSLEMARRAPNAHIRAVDRDGPRLDWAQAHYERLGGSTRLATIEHVATDVGTFELAHHSYDLVVCFFLFGCLEEPGLLLSRIYHALRPGGRLVYYDGCQPTAESLDRLAHWRHRLRIGKSMSDLWSQRRRMEASFAADAVRRYRPENAPPEEHLYHRILETFEVVYETKTRAWIDTVIDKIPRRRLPLYLPVLKLADEATMGLGMLEGACRYLVARKR